MAVSATAPSPSSNPSTATVAPVVRPASAFPCCPTDPAAAQARTHRPILPGNPRPVGRSPARRLPWLAVALLAALPAAVAQPPDRSPIRLYVNVPADAK